ncbi:MAG: sulfatase-like hydrolase/transferase [Flavobacteriales bacterium]|nr:sulfatase-like hydrolase/transferase [Flavobacteriales bacterium]
MPRYPLLLLKLLGVGLITGQLFRLFLFLAHHDQWQDAQLADILHAFLDRGLLFDLYVNAWALLLPALLLGIRYASGSSAVWPVRTARWIWSALFIVILFFGCADVPFYAYVNMRLTDLALSTAQTWQQSLRELVSTPPYLIAVIVFAILSFAVVRITGRFFKTLVGEERPMKPWLRWSWFALSLFALIPGLRGTLDPSDQPLAPEDAYFSNTPFLNQLSTNATYSFVASLTIEHVDYLPSEVAIANVRGYLGITDQRYTSPVARDVVFDTIPDRRNVVLILVESLSANRLHRFGHPKNLMPFLESLMDSSLVYDRFFSAGTRTCNGIFSSLYGLPAIGAQHPMAHPSMTSQPFYGLPSILREGGYHTSFLYPGDPLFDNMTGFLSTNGFDTFISRNDFADSIPRNSWGVTDHALYTKVIEHLDALHAKDRAPFFASIMTISSHKGYNVPDDVRMAEPLSEEGDENIYQYADRAMELFFAQAATHPWFANTVFVILGDHGQRFDPVYEVPIPYHHVPMIIHAPGVVAARMEHGFGTQVDVPETILGLLNIPHVNNTLGLDLRRSQHPLAYFCSDDRICAIDDRSYWIRTGEVERLYDHPSRRTTDVSQQRPLELDSLRTYAMSMVQVAQWLVDEKLVGKPIRADPIKP